MATPVTTRFGAGVLYLGNGATPTEVFNKVCGMKNIQFQFDKKTNEVAVPDCDDPDAPVWDERDVVSQSASFSASGVLAKDALPLIQAAFAASTSRNFRFDLAGFGSGGGTPNLRIAGKFHIKYTIKGERGTKFELEFSGESDGEVTQTSVAAP